MTAGVDSPDVAGLLRAGLLDGVRVMVGTAAGTVAAAMSAAVEQRCATLGAEVARCELAPGAEAADEDALRATVEDALASSGAADVLVVDGAALFEAADPERPLLAGMQACWDLTRAIAAAAMLERDGGLVVLIAPRPGAGEHAAAAAAGLENLARTLSIEWARFATRALAITPGEETAPEEIAVLVAYLSSPAGGYYSGCLLDLRGTAPAT